MKLNSARFKFALALLALAVLVGTGCRTHSGSQEFIPGKGWRPA